MTNVVLFYSSLACTAIHIAGILYHNPPRGLITYMLTGCGTSLWNHGTTSTIAKWADRAATTTGFILTTTLAPTPALQTLTLATTGLYFLAKRYAWTTPHITAHLLLTFIHLNILAHVS